MSIKIIAHPETGKLFTATKKEGWVKCQVKSQQAVVSNGVITLQTRVAFPLVQAEIANSLFNQLKDGDTFPINGKIVRTVTAEPQYEGHQEVVNPETSEAMGYYQSYDFSDNLNASDKGTSDNPYVKEVEATKVEEEETVEHSQL